MEQVADQNEGMKRLLAGLQLRKEDFMVDGSQGPEQQRAALEATGIRLLNRMRQPAQHTAAAGAGGQQQQHAPGAGGTPGFDALMATPSVQQGQPMPPPPRAVVAA